MKHVTVTEGMRHGDVFVLTQAEIDRLIEHELHVVRREVAALRDRLRKWAARYPDMPEPPKAKRTYRPATPYAIEARRATYRRRYQRYVALCRVFDVKRRNPWSTHLAELTRQLGATEASLLTDPVSVNQQNRPAAQILGGVRTAGQTRSMICQTS